MGSFLSKSRESVDISNSKLKEELELLLENCRKLLNDTDTLRGNYSETIFGDESYRTRLRFPSLTVHRCEKTLYEFLTMQARNLCALQKAVVYISKESKKVNKSKITAEMDVLAQSLKIFLNEARTVAEDLGIKLSYNGIQLQKKTIQQETKDFVELSRDVVCPRHYNCQCANRGLAVLIQCCEGVAGIHQTLKNILHG